MTAGLGDVSEQQTEKKASLLLFSGKLTKIYDIISLPSLQTEGLITEKSSFIPVTSTNIPQELQ